MYIRPFSSIELACAVRQPSPCVRALCESGVLVSHVTFEGPLHTSHLTVFTLHTTHFTLHSSHCTLRTSHSTVFTLHTALFALHTSHFTLETSQSTLLSLLTAFFTFHTSRFTLHTSHCTLHALSHCTLHTPNFTLHTALFTPHTSLFTQPKLRKSADKSLSQPGAAIPMRITLFSCKRQEYYACSRGTEQL